MPYAAELAPSPTDHPTVRQTGSVAHPSVADHRIALRAVIGQAATEAIALDRHAHGRRLAAPLLAVDDLPRFDNSAMDGYAAAPVSPDQLTFTVVGDVAAGDAARFRLEPGQAARVMTGARLPVGTVGVVPVEQTDAARTGPAPQTVTFTTPVESDRHIRHRAEDVAAGMPIAATGDLLDPPASPSPALPAASTPPSTCRPGWQWSRRAPSSPFPVRTRAAAGSTSPTPTWSRRSPPPPAVFRRTSRRAPTTRNSWQPGSTSLPPHRTSTSSSPPVVSARAPTRSSDRSASRASRSASCTSRCSRAGRRASADGATRRSSACPGHRSAPSCPSRCSCDRPWTSGTARRPGSELSGIRRKKPTHPGREGPVPLGCARGRRHGHRGGRSPALRPGAGRRPHRGARRGRPARRRRRRRGPPTLSQA